MHSRFSKHFHQSFFFNFLKESSYFHATVDIQPDSISLTIPAKTRKKAGSRGWGCLGSHLLQQTEMTEQPLPHTSQIRLQELSNLGYSLAVNY